jgi:hypothetical protein
MKFHPLVKAKESQVLAVRFGIDQWGFIRIHRGSDLGIWNVWTKHPVAIPDDISENPEKWFCHYLSPNQDDTEMINLGSLPFASDEEAWAPMCFVPPDFCNNHYRFYFRGMYRNGSKDDIEGIQPCERLTPAKLASRLRELCSDGRLVESPISPDSECSPIPGG